MRGAATVIAVSARSALGLDPAEPSGSIERFAAAVGEEAQVVAKLHGFLAKPGP